MKSVFFLFQTSFQGGQNTSCPTLAGVKQLLQDIPAPCHVFDKKYEQGGIAFVKVDTQEKAWAPGLWLVFLKECCLFKRFFSLFFPLSIISQLSKDVYDTLFDSGCNLGSHVPWKEVPGAGGKLPILRPTSYHKNQEAANRVAKAKPKGHKKSASDEILGLIVFSLLFMFFPFFLF